MRDADRAGCAAVEDDLAEVALGVRDPSELPGLTEHLAACPSCRAELADLSTAADRLLLAAPEMDPPAGFEHRAVARMSPVSAGRPGRRRSRWVTVATAAAVVVVVAVGATAALVVGSRGGGSAETARASLVSAAGRTVGRVAVDGAGSPSMTVWLDGATPGVRYRCELVLADGSRRLVGSWTVAGGSATWTVSVPDAPADRVELTRSDGTAVATADLSP